MTKVILTKHALKRLDDRKIPKNMVYETISSPDLKHNNTDGSLEICKSYGNQEVHVILKENEKSESVILSCWINPPNYGSKDFKNKQLNNNLKKSSGIRKFWYTLLNQIGF